MIDPAKTRAEPASQPVMKVALAQPGPSELAELIDSIERLQAALYRFAPVLESNSVAIVTQAQRVLQSIGDEIDRFLLRHVNAKHTASLERWDNEGGLIVDDPR